MTRNGRLNVRRVRDICQQWQLSEGVSCLNLAEHYVAPIAQSLFNAKFALKQNPEEMRNLTLARKHLVLLEVNLLHFVDAMQLIVLQRRKNWNLAQLRKQLLAYLVCGVVLDGLGVFGHWKNRLTAFQSVAKY